jgi:hypothetical protein
LERTQPEAHVSPTPSIHSVRRVFPSTAGSQPFQINPSRVFGALFGLSFAVSSSPTYVQAFLSSCEAITLQLLRFRSTGCAHRPFTPRRLFCPSHPRYYGLIRQSRRLRFASPWATRNGLCLSTACVTFPSLPWLPCSHATTSTPPADRLLLLVHPSVFRAFITGLRIRLTGSFHFNWFRVDPFSKLKVFVCLLRPVHSHGRLTSPRPVRNRTGPSCYGGACPAQGLPCSESTIASQPNQLLLRRDLHPLACQRSKAAQSQQGLGTTTGARTDGALTSRKCKASFGKRSLEFRLRPGRDD